MMRNRFVPWALCPAALLAAGVCAFARETGSAAAARGGDPGSNATAPSPPIEDPALAPYRRFIDSGEGTILLAIARRVYGEETGLPDLSPLDMPESDDRPAGPRDEPPPPEWPEGPTGIVLCLKIGEETRACEGGRLPPSDDLAAAVSDLAARLPASRSRGKQRPLKAAEQPRASLQAAFVVEAKPPRKEPGSNKVSLPEGVDPSLVGFVVEGEGGSLVTLPGDARSLKAALRLARKAGVTGGSRGGQAVWWYRPERIGSVPIVSP